MPWPLLEAYVRELPALLGEQSLRRAMEHAVGSGMMKAEDSRSVMRSWAADVGQVQEEEKAPHPSVWAAMGLNVVRETSD